jgi:trans-aconitate 2-methyltransferase
VTRDWDAIAYQHLSRPQEEWARELLARLPLRGDETVLDAGCGSGRVTSLLIERLPRGRVFAVDASPSMIDAVRGVLRRQDVALLSDLTQLELHEPVDVVFSNAVFHWIPDHDLLFHRLHAALRPGGRLLAQCGGQGNVKRFHGTAHAVSREEPFAPFFAGWKGPWNFASPAKTASRLAAAGFVEVESWLEEREVRPDEPREYLRAVCLRPYLEQLPADLRGPYLDLMLDRLSEWQTAKLGVSARRPVALDYVRLNISGRNAA